MGEIQGLKFSTSIGVLFALREAGGHKTLQETYAQLSRSDMDSVLEVLRVSYNTEAGTSLTMSEFIDAVGQAGIGFVRLSRLYSEVVERLMCDGLSSEEVASVKKLVEEKAKN